MTFKVYSSSSLIKLIDSCRHGLHKFRVFDWMDGDLIHELVGIINWFWIILEGAAVHEGRVWDGSGACRYGVVVDAQERALFCVEFGDDRVK